MTSAAWLALLTARAPGASWDLRWALAGWLASRPSQAELLRMGDTLAAAARGAAPYGPDAGAAAYEALADLVREHAGLLPARIWHWQA